MINCFARGRNLAGPNLRGILITSLLLRSLTVLYLRSGDAKFMGFP